MDNNSPRFSLALITFSALYMLIAIMGATFDRHNEDLHANATRQKLVLQAEFVKLVNAYQKFFSLCCCKRKKRTSSQDLSTTSSGYLFVIQPSQSDENESGDHK